ncbi:glycosyltransferase [Candidatus Sumerlaeota bacterium]|nr:glycosyltransferase [Candidatus Sumerlaeota bacterium]
MAATRVLFVLGALQPGGIQSFLLLLLRHFDRDDVAIDVCTMAADAGPLAEEARRLGATVHTVSVGRSPRRVIAAFERIFSGHKYDALHANRSSSFLAMPIRAARRAGVPVRIAQYQNDFRRNGVIRDTADRYFRSHVLRDATHIIGVSRNTLTTHFGRNWERDGRFEVLPNTVDVSVYTRERRDEIRASFGCGSGDVLIGHSARFSEAKNHVLIMDVAEQICADFPQARFVLAGEGHWREEIVSCVRDCGLKDRIVLPGWCTDMPALLSALDVFFFPSLWEGCPISLLEAQAAGLPCAVSDIPAMRESIAPALVPFMFPARDVSLARNALARLIADGTARGELGAAAREHALRFDINLIAARLREIYRGHSDSGNPR